MFVPASLEGLSDRKSFQWAHNRLATFINSLVVLKIFVNLSNGRSPRWHSNEVAWP